LTFLAHGLGVTGARAEGQQLLRELQRRRYVPPECLGIAYEGLGERERALQYFEKAYSEHSMNGWYMPDPRLDELRREPRFREIMRRMGLPPCRPSAGYSDPVKLKFDRLTSSRP
jgi:predicted TIM-barrel fold metal-dependent hydrolase